MKKIIQSGVSILMLLIIVSCKNDEKIEKLLESDYYGDIIEGAYEAGETGDEKFVPLLLKDAADPRITHILKFKGMSVYQSKMGALKKIYKQKPPVDITYKVDSTVIKFYIKLSEKPL